VLNIEAEEQAKKRQGMPEPAAYEAVVAYASEEMKEKGVDCSRDYQLQLIPVPEKDSTIVRVNISLPKYILDALDADAKRRGTSRSKLIAAHVQEYGGV
jgi:hypothetical protein